MPKGSVRNPGTKDTYVGRIWTRATNRGERQSKNLKEAYAHMNRNLDKMDAQQRADDVRKAAAKSPRGGPGMENPFKALKRRAAAKNAAAKKKK